MTFSAAPSYPLHLYSASRAMISSASREVAIDPESSIPSHPPAADARIHRPTTPRPTEPAQRTEAQPPAATNPAANRDDLPQGPARAAASKKIIRESRLPGTTPARTDRWCADPRSVAARHPPLSASVTSVSSCSNSTRGNRLMDRLRGRIEDVEQEAREETEAETIMVLFASVTSVTSCSNSTGGNRLMDSLQARIEDVEQEAREETEGEIIMVLFASVASVTSCSNSTGGNQLMHRLRGRVEDVEQEPREETEAETRLVLSASVASVTSCSNSPPCSNLVH
jgi:hypothetical protein